MTNVLTYANGFVPTKTLGGSGSYNTVRFSKNASATGADARIAIGDPVRLTSNGTVEKFLTADVSAAVGSFLGVVNGIAKANGAPKHHRPEQSSSVSLSADTTDLFDVIVDRNVVFSVETQLSAQTAVSAAKFIGQTVNVAFLSASGNDDKLGKSTAYVLPYTATSGEFAPFKVIGISDTVQEATNGVTNTNQVFQVVANFGVFNGNTGSA